MGRSTAEVSRPRRLAARGDEPLRSPRNAIPIVAFSLLAGVLLFTTVDPWLPGAGLFMGGIDLDVYRDGAQHVLDGLPLYTEPLTHELLYTYTPFSTLMFVPFALLNGTVGEYIWMGFNFFLLVTIITLCWRILGYRITPYVLALSTLLAVASGFLEPVRTTLFFGQINLVLMLLILWDTARPDGSRIKGVGVGIAAGIKLTPAYFVLYFLALRQWRAAMVAALTIVATVGVSALILPSDSWQYWTKTFFDSTRIGDAFHASNQSLKGAITRLTLAPAPTWVWLLLDAVIAIVSMLVVVRLHRRGETLLAVTLAGMTASILSPFSWSHHWVWFVPLTIWFIHRAVANLWWWTGPIVLFAIAGSWAYQWPLNRLVVGLYLFPPTWVSWDILVNLYVWSYALILAGAAVVAWRAPEVQVSDRAREADTAPS
ncbi:DUF2029 domain-containing protein [Antrihabitans sp. YC2-6]|nr:DUF2029 domain-containing protein [Antrihabitans sp. YC2-6]